jgi:hypothetical protein
VFVGGSEFDRGPGGLILEGASLLLHLLLLATVMVYLSELRYDRDFALGPESPLAGDQVIARPFLDRLGTRVRGLLVGQVVEILQSVHGRQVSRVS